MTIAAMPSGCFFAISSLDRFLSDVELPTGTINETYHFLGRRQL
jgi:hypothetical protein